MKYFTPGLYLEYNSPDDDRADRADEAWESAIRDYQAGLNSFRNLMPPRVAELTDGPSLHDAELIALRADLPGLSTGPSASTMAATISLKLENEIVHLDYLLWDLVIPTAPLTSWPFSKSPVYWLYDEVDFDLRRDGSGSGGCRWFWHRILFSDGRTIEIPFGDVIISRFSPECPEPELVMRAR